MFSRKGKGFTLVELIIVIVILGILAALAVPQFVSSTKDAEDATISADLSVLRNAVNLYYHQHQSQYPGAKKVDGSGTDTAAGDNPAAIVAQLTTYTDKTGKASATIDRVNFPLGPYLTNGVPVNSSSGLSTIKVITATGAMTATDLDGTTGWIMNKSTGEIRVNNKTGYLAY